MNGCSRCGSSAGAELEVETRDGKTTYRFRCTRCRVGNGLGKEVVGTGCSVPAPAPTANPSGCSGCPSCFAIEFGDFE